MKENANERIGFRISKSEKEILEKIASEQTRSVSNLLVNIIKDYVSDYEKAKKMMNRF